MVLLRASVATLVIVLVAAALAVAADMTPGDLLIYRVGDGSTALSSHGDPVFLDEYTPSGTLVQSFAAPTTSSGSNNSLFASGTATSEGMLTLSPNGQYAAFTGYESTGTASLASTAGTADNRVVGIIDAYGNINTSTALSDFADGNNPRSAVTTDGTNIWVSGAAGGVRYTTVGSSTSTKVSTGISNTRQVNIFDGQLYATGSKGSAPGLNAIGTLLPTTTGNTYMNLIPSTTADVLDSFYMCDLNNTGSSDTLYLCDETAGILKFASFDGTWWPEGSAGVAGDIYRGLTGETDAEGDVTLFAIKNGGTDATGGGELVSITDTSGFGNIMNGSFTDLASAGANTAFRGVAFVPVAPTPEPSTVALLCAASAMIVWRLRKRRS